MIDKVSIGRIIKSFRISKHLTQEELSEQIGISKNYLSKIERGISVLNTETFLKAAQILEFSLEDFGVKSIYYQGMDEKKKELLNRIFLLPQNETRAYLKLLDAMYAAAALLK